MGIREQGYRHWDGKYTGHGGRWWTIAKQGIRATVFNKMRLAMLIIFAVVVWAPYFFAGLAAFIGGANSDLISNCSGRVRSDGSGGFVRPSPDLALRCNLYDLFRGWEFLIAPIFIAAVATPLVSGDLRSNAMYIYMSKPVRRVDYIIGKLVAVAVWAFPVTFAPTLFVWFMAVSSQTKVNKLASPYTILLQALVVQAIFVSVIILLVLAVASFTKQWHYAFLGFLGVYLGGWIVAAFVSDITRERSWFYTNIVHNFVNFAQAVWDVPSTPPGVFPSVLIIFGLLAAGFGVFAWRILHLEVSE